MLAMMSLLVSCGGFSSAAEGESMETNSQGNDYDRIAQLLNVSGEEPYYGAYVDYLCYLKKSYPTQAPLKEVKEESGFIEVRIWESADYAMAAKWKAEGGGQVCLYEWQWKNQDTEKTVTGLIENAQRQAEGAGAKGSGDSGNGYAEELFEAMEMAVKGNIYERTPNNFIKGIDLDFSGGDLEGLKGIIRNLVFDEGAAAAEGESKYRVRLYGAAGNHVLDFGIYEDMQVWCQGRKIKEAGPLLNWLDEMVGKDGGGTP